MRSLSLVPLMALAACGSSGAGRGSAAPQPPGSGSAAARPAGADYTPEALCRRLSDISTRCPQFSLGRTEMGKCIQMFEQMGGSSQKPDALKSPTTRCLVEHTECDSIATCMAALVDTTELRACNDPDSVGQRVGIPRAEWERRKGAGVTKFRDAQSTKAAPNEMCGVSEANEWLISLRCDDGSRPLKDRGDAEGVRSGNVGPGGRCDSIIDRYVVPCPEARYEIFIDAYVCAE